MIIESWEEQKVCGRCAQVLPARRLLVVGVARDQTREERARWGSMGSVEECFHLECALDRNPSAFAEAMRFSSPAMASNPILLERAIARVAAIERRKAMRPKLVQIEGQFRSQLSLPDPALFEQPESILPATDLSGRPRVRVLVCGTAIGDRTQFGSPAMLLSTTRCFASAKREYEFVHCSSGYVLPFEDPSQPIVATMYATIATKNAPLIDAQVLCLWAAYGFAPPVLLLTGIMDKIYHTKTIVRARARLVECGLAGDESPVVCAKTTEQKSIARLLAALDEYLEFPRELRAKNDPSLASAEQMLREWREQAVEHWVRDIGHKAALACWGTSPQTESVLETLIGELIDGNALDFAGPLLSRGPLSSPKLYRAWVESALSRDDPFLPSDFRRVCWWLAHLGGTVPTAMVLDRLSREKSGQNLRPSRSLLEPVLLDYATADELRAMYPLLERTHFSYKQTKIVIKTFLDTGVRSALSAKPLPPATVFGM